VGLAKGKENAMISWVVAGAIAALAAVAAAPAVLRVLALMRCAPHAFETHGAANDRQY
jgi:hypothetical protein